MTISLGFTRNASGQTVLVERDGHAERRVYRDGPCYCMRMRDAGWSVMSDCLCSGTERIYDHSSADL